MMMNKTDCNCCKNGRIWHCEYCWNEHHNGRRDKDYMPEPPKIEAKK